jgi:drug/metabolite transporter (DMT)-like permease
MAATVFSAVLFREIPDALAIAGIVLILTSVYLLSKTD